MDFFNILGLAYLFSKGGSGCLPLIIIIILACIIVFIFENFLKIIMGIVILITLSLGIAFIVDHLKYKNESPEDKKKREELEKIKEWSRRNKC